MATALLDLVGTHAEEPSPQGAEIDPHSLAEAQAGDSAALERFVRHYQGPVFAFLSRVMGRGPHVEDLAQEVFLRACRALPRFQPRARVSTWLLGIALRLCLDQKRRRVPHHVCLDDLPLPAPRGGPEQERQRGRIARALEQAAAELSPEQRAVFVLAEFHGLDTEEIAQVTGALAITVRTRLYRARGRLRALLASTWEETR